MSDSQPVHFDVDTGHRRLISHLLLFLGLLATGMPVAGQERAREDPDAVIHILERMSTAVREENYRGLFTFEVGGGLDTYKIVHRTDGEREYERLVKLNGSEREVLRSGQVLDCLSTGDRLLRGLLPSSRPASKLRDNYQFYLTGEERVAGRDAMMVQIVPKDRHRFGYTLGVDRDSGFPLMAMRVSEEKQVIERIQFIELTVGADITAEELEPSTPEHREVPHDLADCEESGEGEPRWEAGWLPSGFVFTDSSRAESGAQMLSYTDGLATFSIFIAPADGGPALEGRAQLGASVAYVNQRIWNRQPHSVTVVGEIPFATAQRVLTAVEPRSLE